MKRIALVFGVVGIVLVSTGCGKIREKLAHKAEEKALEGATGGAVTVSSGGTVVTDPKSGTTVGVAGAAKLPDGWPSNIPVYSGGSITASMASPVGKTVIMSTSDSPSKVHDFYKSELKSLKLMTDLDAAGSKVMNFKDGGKTVSITIAPSGATTQITISVAGA